MSAGPTPSSPPRPVKKRKVDKSESVSKRELFMQWAQDRGVGINGVKPASLPGRGMGLVTTKKISKGERLVHVPASAMIKPDTNRFPRLSSHSAQARLAGTLYLQCRETGSVYAPYVEIWPRPEDFESCLFWYSRDGAPRARDELFLPSSAIHAAVSRLVRDFELDHANVSDASDAELKMVEKDVATFAYFWTIANTRSFAWKPAGDNPGMMVMCPFLDYMNHCPSGQGCDVSVGVNGYTLTADRDYDEGEEILATYGAHSNDKLLVHLPNSPDDFLSLDPAILPRLDAVQIKDLENVGYLGNYSFQLGSHEPCFRTQVAMRTRCQTSNEWEYYMNSGEDIRDYNIESDLASLIRKDRESRQEGLEKLEKAKTAAATPAEAAALQLLIDRANEVEGELERYCGLH